MHLDLRLLELVASKLCHDLISPVGAINNGVELIEDIGESVMSEAMKLIGDSAVNASRRLRLFRVAYGRAGSAENLATRAVRQIAEQSLTGGKIKLQWPENALADELANRRGGLKVLLNLIMLAEEILPYGGSIILAAQENGCRLDIEGRNAQLSPAFQAALDDKTPVEDLTPRTVQSNITGKFAAYFGLEIRHEQVAPDRFAFVLSAPPLPREEKVPL